MRLPYESATSGDRALSELQRMLSAFGCQSFGTMVDGDKGVTLVQFKWRSRTVCIEASWRGYASAWLKAHPYKYPTRLTRLQHENAAIAQAKISVCSVLRDWVKGQITAVECGAIDFESAFLPHMLTNDGMRVVDRIKSDNLLPAPEVADA